MTSAFVTTQAAEFKFPAPAQKTAPSEPQQVLLLRLDQDAFYNYLSPEENAHARAFLAGKDLMGATPEQKLQLLEELYRQRTDKSLARAFKSWGQLALRAHDSIKWLKGLLEFKNFEDVVKDPVAMGKLIKVVMSIAAKAHLRIDFHTLVALINTPGGRLWLEEEKAKEALRWHQIFGLQAHEKTLEDLRLSGPK